MKHPSEIKINQGTRNSGAKILQNDIEECQRALSTAAAIIVAHRNYDRSCALLSNEGWVQKISSMGDNLKRKKKKQKENATEC